LLFLVSSFGVSYFCYNIFRACANTEFATPYAKTTTDIILGFTALIGTVGTLIDALRNPGDRPYLSVMSMPTELEVYMMVLGLF
jgi:hypothetical protein